MSIPAIVSALCLFAFAVFITDLTADMFGPVVAAGCVAGVMLVGLVSFWWNLGRADDWGDE